MIGCSFVVDREYFGDIGLLDPGMEVYGGENIELGMRVSGRSGHWVRRAGPPGCDELRGWSALGCTAGSVPVQAGEARPPPRGSGLSGPWERRPLRPPPARAEAAVPSCGSSQGP